MSAPCILLVDDQREVLRLLHSTLDTLAHDLEVFEAPSGEEALLEASRRKIDLLVADYRLPGITGVELMRKVRVKNPDVRVILITGMTDRNSREDILNAGAAAVFNKPISMTDFLDVVERLLGLERTILPDENPPDVKRHQTLSNLLANLRQDINAQSVFLLSDRGRVLARAGDLKDNSMEASLLSALMAIYSAGLKVSRFLHQVNLESYHVFSGGDQELLLIPVNTAYALLVSGNDLATSKKIIDTVAAMLAVRNEVEKALKSIGVAPIVVDEEDEKTKFGEADIQSASDEFAMLLKSKKKISNEELEAYWEAAAKNQGNVPTNPDVITYEQARKLGLAPGEKN